ncbi:MAG: 50S ribosomal protein L2 [Planctomycetota bacterium]|nr:50S ribosomal protein L2 [Planctomycetota bacterium]MCX8040836.1 50S ribosomal protein L2 [Planctomycetota bacterium]MDW8372287.1 50S ribosomal protein L2 [Planctomycetota bacterium]
MPYRRLHTASPGARHATIPDFSEITKDEPEKSLVIKIPYRAGRNSQGRITCWHKGGRHPRLYRLVDFKRKKLDVPGKVTAIEYDPYRNCRIALVTYADGEKGYILAAKDLQVGMTVVSYSGAGDPNIGCAMELRHVPQGIEVHNVELQPGRGGQLARAAGTFARLMAIDGDKAILALPSGEIRRVPATCRATIGVVGRGDANVRVIGKAGRNRWLGIRPTVSGNSMNPIAHPLGGGEGHTNGGRQHCSPWGLVDGKKTRKRKNRNNVFIIRRRDGRAMTTEA